MGRSGVQRRAHAGASPLRRKSQTCPSGSVRSRYTGNGFRKLMDVLKGEVAAVNDRFVSAEHPSRLR
eukprot:3362921-Pyramimonas_sp.AAC.2